MRGENRVRKLLQVGGLPEDALLDCARVMLTGRSSVAIEGQHGVIELSAERIRIQTGSGMLAVNGQGLELRELSPEKAVVLGKTIDAISFQ